MVTEINRVVEEIGYRISRRLGQVGVLLPSIKYVISIPTGPTRAPTRALVSQCCLSVSFLRLMSSVAFLEIYY